MNSPLTDRDPFSEVAERYDASFTRLPSVFLLRERIHDLIERYFPRSGTILDLACGTGPDAIILAERGFHVVAADRSYMMLATAAAKSCSMPAGPLFVQMDAASLSPFRDAAFDAILSNFGGLNCVADLSFTLRECHRVLRPNGTMVLCLLGAHSVWEATAFALRGAWKSAGRRRSKSPVPVTVGQHEVDTWYHSIRSVRRSAGDRFEVVAIAGLNVVAPPPASQSFARQHPKVTALLFSLDRLIQTFPCVRALGDHTVFVLKRRAVP